MKYTLLLIAALLAPLGVQAGDKADKQPVISQQALMANQMSAAPYVILDVRTAKEFADGHLKNALNIPHTELADRLAELPGKDAPIVVHCRSGKRAAIAEQLLKEKGYSHILHLEGDYLGWQEAKLPLIEEKK